jgi:hypothetical protein
MWLLAHTEGTNRSALGGLLIPALYVLISPALTTVYSENADPVQRWYRILWRGGLPEHATIEEARQKLEVEELGEAPWNEAS